MVERKGCLMTTTTNPTPVGSSAAEQEALAKMRADLRKESRKAIAAAIFRSLMTFVVTMTTVLVIWWGTLIIFDISPFVAKSPPDVWEFLVTADAAADNRATVGGYLATTMGHSVSGFFWGMLVAIGFAVLFNLSKGIENTFMPVAMLLRSVPLVAMAPVIIMITGRYSGAAATIGAIVVLFPALVTIANGLKAASPQLSDVVTVYGGSQFTVVRKVSLPSALPSLFAAIRISVPGAITGALLAEWLATGDGLGGAISRAANQSQFPLLWSGVVVITVVALVLYAIAQTIENAVLARMGMSQSS